MSKGTWTLLGILAALVAAAYLVMQRTGEMNATATPEKTLVAVDSAAANRIEVHTPTMHIVVERGPSGWMMTQPAQGPADPGRVASFLSDAGKIELVSTASTNPQKHGLFHVDSTGTRFVIATEKKDSVSFIIGKPQQGATSMRDIQFFARKAGSNDVWLTRTMLAFAYSYSPDLWRDRVIISTPRESIDRVVYAYGDTTFTLSRQDTSWFVDGTLVHSTLVPSVIGTLSSLQATGFADTVTGLMPKPSCVITLLGKTVMVFKHSKEDMIVTVSDKPQRFLVRDYTINDILHRKREFLP